MILNSQISSTDHTSCIELATSEPLELGLPHVALHDGVKVLEPVELGARYAAPELFRLKIGVSDVYLLTKYLKL